MKAVTQHRYGRPDVLQFEDVETPPIEDDQILVKVRAASINPYDWHMMTGTPWLVRLQNGFRRPKHPVQGADVAGTVEAVGAEVTEFAAGDEVFGFATGSFAEYAVSAERRLAAKPANVTFEEAASVPMAAVTALQGLRDTGRLRAGQRVLVNGASGGVGTFAVMIAKAMGAHVTAVCSTRNTKMVHSIGADEVIDYTQTDYTTGDAQYDLILDTVTTKSVRANRRVMNENGMWVQAGMKKKSSVIMLLLGLLKLRLVSIGRSKKMRSMLSRPTKDDLVVLQKHLESGEIRPVIDRSYPLAETADAMRHQGEGHAQGKTVITV